MQSPLRSYGCPQCAAAGLGSEPWLLRATAHAPAMVSAVETLIGAPVRLASRTRGVYTLWPSSNHASRGTSISARRCCRCLRSGDHQWLCRSRGGDLPVCRHRRAYRQPARSAQRHGPGVRYTASRRRFHGLADFTPAAVPFLVITDTPCVSAYSLCGAVHVDGISLIYMLHAGSGRRRRVMRSWIKKPTKRRWTPS